MTDWELIFHNGKVETKRFTSNANRSPESSLAGIEIELILEPSQVRVVEENLSHPNAVVLQDVPDGSNLVTDNSTDKRQTVTIEPPSEEAHKTLAYGEYVVVEWETIWRASRPHLVTLGVVEKKAFDFQTSQLGSAEYGQFKYGSADQ